MMILGLAGVHHFNGLVEMGIKRLTLRRDRAQSQLGQGILQLPVDQFDSAAKLRLIRGTGLQGALETIQAGQNRLQCIGERVFTELLLFADTALARVLEFGLQSRQPVDQRIALGFELVEVRLTPFAPSLGRGACRTRIITWIRGGQFVPRIQLRRVNLRFSVSSYHTVTQIRSVSCQKDGLCMTPRSWCAGNQGAWSRSRPAIPLHRGPPEPERR